MGKGYNNFMSKKTFHPGSNANQERVREAEARSLAKRKHDEETLAQYLKEQELFNQRSLISKESKEKLSLSFMYELPPGVAKKDSEKNSEKVEWTGSSANSKPISSNLLSDSSSAQGEPGLRLEWKRDKTVKNSNQHRRINQLKHVVKKEENGASTSDLKTEEKEEKPRLKGDLKETKQDLKRFKRERQT